MTRTVIRGGDVFDSRSGNSYTADVVIEADRIVEVGPGLDGDDTIDATGRAVYPGSSTATSTSWRTVTSIR